MTEESRLAMMYVSVVDTQPLLKADAVVALLGMDAAARTKVAAQVMAQGGANNVVLSGGLSQPPHVLGAKEMLGDLLGAGVRPSLVILEKESQNTHEQAVNVVALAKLHEWKRIIIVASPFHLYRAFLTVLQAVIEEGLADTLHVVPLAASQTSWFEPPEGTDGGDRLSLLDDELAKIAEYHERGHVATYQQALDYFRSWAGK